MELSHSPQTEALKAEAAAWVVRLDTVEAGVEDRARFELWRAQGPAYDVAFERELAAWRALDRLAALKPDGVNFDAGFLEDPGDVGAAAPTRRWVAAAAFGGVAALAGAGAVLGLPRPVYATGLGEHRKVILADASVIELNTDSRVQAGLGRDRRSLRLTRGEALFEIAPERRPTVVYVGAAAITTGEEAASVFCARLHASGSAVTVVRGNVTVSGHGAAGPKSMVQNGQQAFYGGGAVDLHSIDGAELARTLAWRQGAIVFSGQSLSEGVEEFNRYNHRKIVVTDDSIAGLRLAGYFKDTDVRGFVQALTGAFPVAATQAPDGSLHLSRRESEISPSPA